MRWIIVNSLMFSCFTWHELISIIVPKEDSIVKHHDIQNEIECLRKWVLVKEIVVNCIIEYFAIFSKQSKFLAKQTLMNLGDWRFINVILHNLKSIVAFIETYTFPHAK